MSLYRARPEDGVAWITGASTGIGRQVAIDLARAGYIVAATARDDDKLEEVAEAAIKAGTRGRIVPMACDVKDTAAMERTVDRIEGELGPIVLAIFNAGTYSPTLGERLEVENFHGTFTVNLFGVVNGLVPVSDRMRERGHGQIAITGSVTAYFGLPSAAAYGATKAALNSMARSLKYDFDKLNIRIQVFNPGFVDTPLTKKNKFAMPALMKVEDAGARYVEGLKTGGFEVSFPRRLSYVLKAFGYLPDSLYYRLVRRVTGWDERRVASGKDKRRVVSR
ncbi:SDR family NAD(P)-dependent oxidoreductase [Aliihoeflea sp. 40Bstr573]|uniref:SDR family NAD(P)-dependent oxidoreductase n=1 Tax=Aliihoeflea sp. 40Bstr573 TaxID=2696467 RepID=UPI0020953FD2|nr:SDR family NAD(P)-dependent oxidoreductase [Aliihoeflea sp. 40Bstr573]MCO6388953.1 SDR family NAD(P)-dependent oxidoreductase [Aliihoeflea sp. 40Bstr573]